MPTPDPQRFDFATGTNANFVESLYAKYKDDAASVDPTWQKFFEGYEFAQTDGAPPSRNDEARHNSQVEALINAYRRLGHLSAHLNPLGTKPESSLDILPEAHGLSEVNPKTVFHPTNLPKSQMEFGEILQLLRETYCGYIGADYREMNDINAILWLQERMENTRNQPELSSAEKQSILEQLNHSEGFERFLQDRYLGQKRFSLEGTDSLIPLLHTIAEDASSQGVEELNLGMAHRGRLNVLANFLGKHYELIFKEFEGTEFNPFDIDGDVKYHMGFANEKTLHNGNKMRLYLLPNPSHLEAVNPVLEGFTRARQNLYKDVHRKKLLPIVMHGDAAMMGQGVVAETLNLAGLESYETGGTIHIIINNQIGFTAEPCEARSCTYSSDIAKMVKAPVLHVNADHPEAVAWTGKLAVAFRQHFGRDIVIDLIGYRRHGHNETDEPGFTQPLMYKKIKDHETCYTRYAAHISSSGVIPASEIEQNAKSFRTLLQGHLETVRAGQSKVKDAPLESFALNMNYTKVARPDFERKLKTTINKKDLKTLGDAITSFPEDFHPHPKITRLFESRRKMLDGAGQIDWGMAELLAYASLAKSGYDVRLSGQDCRRGTFSHRHGVIFDFENGKPYHVLRNLGSDQGAVDIINSPLSEAGVLGFEFGYSVADPRGLTLWEAQFGDFANGAQIIIDQFLVASEAKWKQVSGLVLLLPHGYEGQGPEHSSARPERFLQLCGNLNIQVANPTTPSQLFHLLRRQTLRHFRKPLVVMTPKSLLRHSKVVSTISDFTSGEFNEVMDDTWVEEPSKVERVLLCSGKLYYDLIEKRDAAKSMRTTAIIRIEQLYPFPDKPLPELLERYYNASEVVWVQEEPLNMGAWYFVQHRLHELLGDKIKISYVGRKGSGTTAEGSGKAHQREQERIVCEALGIDRQVKAP